MWCTEYVCGGGGGKGGCIKNTYIMSKFFHNKLLNHACLQKAEPPEMLIASGNSHTFMQDLKMRRLYELGLLRK